MTLTAFLLVLISVFLHAAWNFMSKRANPSGAYYMLSSGTASMLWLGFFLLSSLSLASLPWIFWVFLTGSILSEGIYMLGLAYAYRNCDISMAYPLGRALPVLMVAAVTLIFGLGKTPSGIALCGMLVIFFGCILLPLKHRQDFRWKTYCSKTSFFLLMIASGTTGYTILDSQAERLLRSIGGVSPLMKTLVYIYMIETGMAVLLFFYVLPNRTERAELKRLLRSPYPYLTGLCSSCAYVLILLAMGYVSNVSYIQAFRQMSLPLGVFAGIFFLKESPAPLKLAGVALIVLGLIMAAF